MLGLPFIVALSLTVSPTYAARPERGTWSGTQVPAPMPPEQMSELIETLSEQKIIEISGFTMLCWPEPYTFGDITITYEVINYMRIIITYPLDPSEPIDIYSYPHYGTFTWYGYNDQGPVELTGTFRSKGGKAEGHLWARGDGIFVKGEYWVDVWIYQDIQYPLDSNNWLTIKFPAMLGHDGWYMTTDES